MRQHEGGDRPLADGWVSARQPSPPAAVPPPRSTRHRCRRRAVAPPGLAEPGIVRTARRTRRGTGRPSMNASRTASPRPPSSRWSSTVSRQPVLLGGLAQGATVDGLDRVQVDHPDRDALAAERLGGGQRLVDGDARGDDGQPVLARRRAAPCCRRSGTPPWGRRSPGSRRGRCAGTGCRPGRPSRRRVSRSGWRRTGTARSSRTSPGTSPGPPAPSGRARPGRSATPACEPTRLMPEPLIEAMRTKSCARVRNAANVEAYGTQPRVGHPDGGGDQLLLGDVALEVAVGVFLGEELGAGGVADLAVQGDDVAAGGAERGERLRRRRRGWPPRRRSRSGAVPRGRPPRRAASGAAGGSCTSTRSSRTPPSSAIASSASGSGLPCRPSRSWTEADALALEGAGEDRGRLALGGLGLAVCPVDRVDVVAVHLDGVPAEGLEAAGVGVEVVAVPGRAALAEPVDVDDHGEVVQVLVPGVLGGLPDGALGHLAVAAQHPDAVARYGRAACRPARCRRRREVPARANRWPSRPTAAAGASDALPAGCRACGRSSSSVVVDRARRLVRGVQQGRGVALGEDEAVVAGVCGAVEVVAHVVGEQYGHQVGGGHRGGGVPGARGGGGADTVDAQLLGEFVS